MNAAEATVVAAQEVEVVGASGGGACKDTELTCLGCDAKFTWTAVQREFFAERGLTTRPQRCKECNKRRAYIPSLTQQTPPSRK